MTKKSAAWIKANLETLATYRKMIDQALEQLNDDELNQSLSPNTNSIAVILRHIGGNLRSRWTDFLDSDGEKPDRNRDQEFEPWNGDRQSLVDFLDSGWSRCADTISSLSDSDLDRTVTIRGEQHTVQLAIVRAITHISYHVGQVLLIARALHPDDWKWLSIPPGQSEHFNQQTWGEDK